ncbi:MAG TPA: GNAT family N-acetyltransferase [Aliidongia sp.]|nr:GNAT family N-acetyltransferase [Aliidongia sp.]
MSLSELLSPRDTIVLRPAFPAKVPQAKTAWAPTVFHEPWWLSAASKGSYQEVQQESGGKLVGRLPFVVTKKYGTTTIDMPMLTHFLGPAVDPGMGSDVNRLLRSIAITRKLIDGLPPASSIRFKLHRGITDTIAFEASGFRTEVQFTAEIAPDAEDALWRRMRDKTRNVIRRAEEQLTVTDAFHPASFIRLYEENLRRRGLKNYYDSALVTALITECVRRGVGRVLVALNDQSEPVSAVFVVWDNSAEYYLLSTRTSDAGNGAVSLLIWTAIRHAAQNGLIFDFDGARGLADSSFYCGFGGTVVPRYWVSKNSFSRQIRNEILNRRR